MGAAPAKVRSAVVGLGNPFMCDDAVGLAVARQIHEQIPESQHVDLIEAAVGGLELAEMLIGYDKAVIIDAIQTDGGRVGDFCLLDLERSSSGEQPAMTHQVGLLEGLELSRRLGMKVPACLKVYAVEVAEPYTFGTDMTDQVKAAVPRVALKILAAEFGVSHKRPNEAVAPRVVAPQDLS